MLSVQRSLSVLVTRLHSSDNDISPSSRLDTSYLISVSNVMASVEEFPIARLFDECLQKYRELCLRLTSNNGKLQQGTFTSQLSDEYGRLRIWGRNSGADRTGRSSLDDILRLDTSLRSIVLDLLGVLLEDLGRGNFT